jgi:hypothetical protein
MVEINRGEARGAKKSLNDLLNLISLNTAGTDIGFLNFALVPDFNSLQIRLKLPFCLIMRMTDIIANLR